MKNAKTQRGFIEIGFAVMLVLGGLIITTPGGGGGQDVAAEKATAQRPSPVENAQVLY